MTMYFINDVQTFESPSTKYSRGSLGNMGSIDDSENTCNNTHWQILLWNTSEKLYCDVSAAAVEAMAAAC